MLLKQAINTVNVSLTMSYSFSSQQEVSQLCQHKCQVPGPGDNCIQKISRTAHNHLRVNSLQMNTVCTNKWQEPIKIKSSFII